MMRLKLRVFIGLVTMCMVAGYEYSEESKFKLHNNKKLKETFDKLLHRVTSLNKERLYSLKKFNDLQNYRPKVGLRTGDEIVAVIIPGTAAVNYDTDDDIHKRINIARDAATLKTSDERDEDDDNIIDSKETGLKETDPLRQWKGCTKSAAKHCRIACKRASKAICMDYKCSKSMKKDQKKKCNNECNSEFSYDFDDY